MAAIRGAWNLFGCPMTRDQYLAALKHLGLTTAGKATAEALGVSLRQAQHYAAGALIPKRVEIILDLLLARNACPSACADSAALPDPADSVPED